LNFFLHGFIFCLLKITLVSGEIDYTGLVENNIIVPITESIIRVRDDQIASLDSNHPGLTHVTIIGSTSSVLPPWMWTVPFVNGDYTGLPYSGPTPFIDASNMGILTNPVDCTEAPFNITILLPPNNHFNAAYAFSDYV
jgi:hypothetical protein